MKNKFTIWKKVTIQNKPELEAINISGYAKEILNKIPYPVKKQTIDLVKVNINDLFKDNNWHTYKDICNQAKKLGLDLCPPQVGPQLRDDYRDQPNDEWLYIGMEPITDPGGGPNVFKLGRLGDGRWLGDDLAWPDYPWNSDDKFVFSFRKSLKLGHSDPLRFKKHIRKTKKKECKHRWIVNRLPSELQSHFPNIVFIAYCSKCLEKKYI